MPEKEDEDSMACDTIIYTCTWAYIYNYAYIYVHILQLYIIYIIQTKIIKLIDALNILYEVAVIRLQMRNS